MVVAMAMTGTVDSYEAIAAAAAVVVVALTPVEGLVCNALDRAKAGRASRVETRALPRCRGSLVVRVPVPLVVHLQKEVGDRRRRGRPIGECRCALPQKVTASRMRGQLVSGVCDADVMRRAIKAVVWRKS